jgi:hypothetical protein
MNCIPVFLLLLGSLLPAAAEYNVDRPTSEVKPFLQTNFRQSTLSSSNVTGSDNLFRRLGVCSIPGDLPCPNSGT